MYITAAIIFLTFGGALRFSTLAAFMDGCRQIAVEIAIINSHHTGCT